MLLSWEGKKLIIALTLRFSEAHVHVCVCVWVCFLTCMSVGWYGVCACAKLEIKRKRNNENKTCQGNEKMWVKNSNGITRDINRRQERNSIGFSSALRCMRALVCVSVREYIYQCDVDCVLLLCIIHIHVCVCKLRFCVCSGSCIFGRGQVGGYSRAVIVVSCKAELSIPGC